MTHRIRYFFGKIYTCRHAEDGCSKLKKLITMLKNGLWEYMVIQLAAGEHPPINLKIRKNVTGQLWVVKGKLGSVEVKDCCIKVDIVLFGEFVKGRFESYRYIRCTFFQCVQNRHKNLTSSGSGIGLRAEADFPCNNK